MLLVAVPLWVIGVAFSVRAGEQAFRRVQQAAPFRERSQPRSQQSQDAHDLNFGFSVGAGGRVKLEGKVSTEAVRTEILNEARVVFGAENVQSMLQLDPNANTQFWPTFKEVLKKSSGLKGGSFVLSGKEVRLSGMMPREVDRLALLDVVSDVSNDAYRIVDQLHVARNLEDHIQALLADETINFEVETSTLTPESVRLLQAIGKILMTNPEVNIRIDGHTHSIGDTYNNKRLSVARAQSVREFLIAEGVSRMRLRTAGWGDTKPAFNNATPEGRAKNNRIEFHIWR